MSIRVLAEKAGLSDKESLIYEKLLRTGPLTIAGIAAETGLYRPAVYAAVAKLVDKQIVSIFPKEKRKLYIAENPEALKRLLEHALQDFEHELASLKNTPNLRIKEPRMKYLKGRKGIGFVFHDLIASLGHGDIFYRYDSARDQERSDSYVPFDYRAKRDRKHLERFVITSELIQKAKKPRLERDIRTIPKSEGVFEHDIIEFIYDGKIAFIDLNSESAIIIENQAMAEFHKHIFRVLYHRL